MSTRTSALRVGLLLIVGVAAGLGLVLFLTRSHVGDGVHYETYFNESVQGLDVGAPVKFRGVTLGQVTEIGLVTAAYMADQAVDARSPASRMVLVRWVIDPKRMGRMPDEATAVGLGLRARLASQGITGLVYVELDFADPRRFPAEKVPWTPRDLYLPSMPSTYTQVQGAAQALAAKLQGIDIGKMAGVFQQVLDDLHGELSSGDTRHALADLAALAHTLRVNAEQADLPGLVAELKGLAETLRTTVGGKETKGLLASSTEAAQRLSTAAGRLPALIAALEATIRRADAGTSDVQAGLVPVLRDARAAAANLRETSETLRRYPASILLGAPPPRSP
jgi:ABC-type transporter Mla subunit MlaD